MLARRIVSRRSRQLVGARLFSQAPPGDEITPAEIQENLEKIESHKKFLQHTSEYWIKPLMFDDISSDWS
jgi:hypothetical protein